MSANITKQLLQFGLSENEALVYTTCLSLGPASVQQIAQKANLNRVTVYGIVEHLTQKGFLHEAVEGNKRKIVAYSPTKLWDIIEERHKQLERQTALLRRLEPSLKAITKESQTGTNISTYEGYEAMKSYTSDVLTCEDEILEWTRIENYTSRFTKYLNEIYFPRKKKLQIPTRFLFIDTPKARKFIQERYLDDPTSSPMKARFVDQATFDIEGFVVIYNNKYSINIPSKMRAIVIEDDVIADTQRKLFELAWQCARDEIQNRPYPLDKK